MKYFAVIDTNVLVSAMIKPQSVPRQVLNLAFAGPIIPVLNDAIEQGIQGSSLATEVSSAGGSD